MPLFDAYVFADWSAASSPTGRRPRKDAIWIGAHETSTDERYFPTRRAAYAFVRDTLRALVDRGRRVLVGMDFSYAYPRGLADAAGFEGDAPAWLRTFRALAASITDDDENRTNRFAVAASINARVRAGAESTGPFWGCPGPIASRDLRPGKVAGGPRFPFVTRTGATLDELRLAERRIRATHPTVRSPFQLWGAGCVGSQALVGIPYVHALRFDPALEPVSRVWPFETDFGAAVARDTGPFVVHAEVWPVLLDAEVRAACEADRTLIRDRAQVRAICAWAAREDAAGRLAAAFDPRLDDDVRAIALAEEGWILGVA